MRFPEFLKEHGTIGFVAPSFGCATEPYYTAFAHARERFGQMGYHTQMGPNCLVDKGIGISNDPALCGKELNESYCGTENDVIISCGGGELMDKIKQIADQADMIINGYAFTREENRIRILNLNNPEKALVISEDGTVLETTMDDIEICIVTDYWKSDREFMEDGDA